MGMTERACDLLVVGGGPGGYTAAIRSAQKGLKTILVERGALGGTCLNWGCVPTKTLLENTRLISAVRRCGFMKGEMKIKLKRLIEAKDTVVEMSRSRVASVLAGNGVRVLRGEASFVGPGAAGGKRQDQGVRQGSSPKTIWVLQDGKKESYRATRVIIATGSKVVTIPTVSLDGHQILSSDETLNMQTVPKEMVIIGGGVIGVEFATIFNALGTRVTVVEMLPTIISGEDDEVTGGLRSLLENQGIRILTDTEVTGASTANGEVYLKIRNISGGQEEIRTDRVLVAVGRAPQTEGLGIEAIGFQMDGPFIKVNARMETNVDGVYAIGDVIGKTMLAHAASTEGIIAVENILGKPREIDYQRIPRCIYAFPEVASVGVNAKEAREKGLEIKVGKFPYQYNGRAVAMGNPEGFVKIIAEKESGEILGVHILGEHATELIPLASLAMQNGVNLAGIKRTVFPHPTLAETLFEASLAVDGEAIHLLGDRVHHEP
jgi:dihydrolipoamide dehydrogenase